jgi:hypothetical protein
LAGFLCETFARRRTDGGPKEDNNVVVVVVVVLVRREEEFRIINDASMEWTRADTKERRRRSWRRRYDGVGL